MQLSTASLVEALQDKELAWAILSTMFGGNPLEFGDEMWRQKTVALGLPVVKEIMPLAFFFLTQYRRVTDRQTDGQTRCVAIAITRASIASRG